MLEQFGATFAVGAIKDAERTFRGMASVYSTIANEGSWQPTKFVQGAFAKSLAERMDRIRVLWQHDPHCPIGKPTYMADTDEGLEIEARLSDVMHGNEALTLLRDKVVDELSVGFTPVKWSMEERGDGKIPLRVVTEATLYEVSLVTFAANPDARVYSVHGIDPAQLEFLAADAPALMRELMAGRKVADRNMARLRAAVKALQDVISEAEAERAPKASETRTGTLSDAVNVTDAVLRASIEQADHYVRHFAALAAQEA